jgi:hypothetical protein
MKCANCDRSALYVYEGPGIRAIGYCDTDLPRFLQGPAKSGSLRTTSGFEAVQRDALRALSPIQAVAVDTAPAPAPRKKRRKAAPAPVEVTEEIIEEVVEVVEESVVEADTEETTES